MKFSECQFAFGCFYQRIFIYLCDFLFSNVSLRLAAFINKSWLIHVTFYLYLLGWIDRLLEYWITELRFILTFLHEFSMNWRLTLATFMSLSHYVFLVFFYQSYHNFALLIYIYMYIVYVLVYLLLVITFVAFFVKQSTAFNQNRPEYHWKIWIRLIGTQNMAQQFEISFSQRMTQLWFPSKKYSIVKGFCSPYIIVIYRYWLYTARH